VVVDYFLLFSTPIPGEDFQFDYCIAYFSKGLVQPPTSTYHMMNLEIGMLTDDLGNLFDFDACSLCFIFLTYLWRSAIEI